VRAITDKNIAHREAINLKLTELRRELGGTSPHPLERLLVERVVLCWLHVHHADVQCAYATSVTLEYGDYLQRQQERAQRRYLAAIKCLATVRRLALPIKVAVTVEGAVESQPRPACRRPVDEGHSEGLPSGGRMIAPKTVNRVGQSHVR
jgi:hypothetical protein